MKQPFTIRTSSNAKEVAYFLSRVHDRIVKKTVDYTARETLKMVRTRILDDTNKATGVEKKILRKRFHLKRTNPKNRLFIGTVPVPVILLKAKELKATRNAPYGKGVSYKGKGGRQKLEKSFIRTGLKNKVHVFTREPGSTRLPVDVEDVEIRKPIERSARRLVAGFMPRKYKEIFAREFARNLDKEATRFNAKHATIAKR